MALNGAGGVHIEIVDACIESNRIKQVLAEKDLTQEELARCVGISYRHMNRLVLGESDPSYLLVCRIGAVLQHPLDRLFQVNFRTRRRVPRRMTDAEFARRKAAVSERQRAAAHKAWTTRRARKAAVSARQRAAANKAWVTRRTVNGVSLGTANGAPA